MSDFYVSLSSNLFKVIDEARLRILKETNYARIKKHHKDTFSCVTFNTSLNVPESWGSPSNIDLINKLVNHRIVQEIHSVVAPGERAVLLGKIYEDVGGDLYHIIGVAILITTDEIITFDLKSIMQETLTNGNAPTHNLEFYDKLLT